MDKKRKRLNEDNSKCVLNTWFSVLLQMPTLLLPLNYKQIMQQTLDFSFTFQWLKSSVLVMLIIFFLISLVIIASILQFFGKDASRLMQDSKQSYVSISPFCMHSLSCHIYKYIY